MKDKRRIKFSIAAVLAVIMLVCTFFAFFGLPATAAVSTAANTNAASKVQVKDLYERHGVDYVVGPIAEYAKADGSYTGTYRDIGGAATNNIYGIPANRYFDADNYLQIETQGTDSVLRGWKAGIKAVIPDGTTWITEKGYIATSTTPNPTSGLGIYCEIEKNVKANDSCKYMIIVPDYVTKIGYGNSAWDGFIPYRNVGTDYTGLSSTQYYGAVDYNRMSGESAEIFTDFSFFRWDMYNNSYNFNSYASSVRDGSITFANYWSPRERLVGVYFNDSSNLTEIVDGTVAYGTWSNSGESKYTYMQSSANNTINNGTRVAGKQKTAFANCNNLRFFVLPNNNTVSKIGDYAFGACSQMVELNISPSVESIGDYAFKKCSGLVHISVPSKVTAKGGAHVFEGTTRLVDVENNSNAFSESDFPNKMNIYGSSSKNGANANNKSMLFSIGSYDEDNGTRGFYYCKNTYGYDGTLATLSTVGDASALANKNYNSATKVVSYKKNDWYVTGPSGKVSTSEDIIFSLPATIAADKGTGANKVQDKRRENISYDFLTSEGTAYKNDFTESITSYDIGANMSKETWCVNIVIPHTVKVIGDEAFKGAHTQYMEIHATTIGKLAFNENRRSTYSEGYQFYYLHDKVSNYGDQVFTMSSTTNYISGNKNIARWYIFENQSLYNSNASSAVFVQYTQKYYQIPVVANVVSQDGDVAIKGNQMETVFSNDADYADGSWKKLNGTNVGNVEQNANGTYTITLTKRLNGTNFSFAYKKQNNGSWVNTNNTDIDLTLNGMTSTNWFSNSGCTTSITQFSNSTSTIYTKKIAKPVLKTEEDRTFDFGGGVIGEGDNYLDFGAALLDNNSSDYIVSLESFSYPVSGTGSPARVQNAGNYRLKVDLNEKWGKWETNYASDVRQGTVKVNRQLIELGDLANLPVFTGNGVQLGGTGIGTTLYEYADGWFMYPQEGAGFSTADVVNSYSNYIGVDIKLSHSWAGNPNALFTVEEYGGTHKATESGKYDAYFALRVKYIDGTDQTNYQFTDNQLNANSADFVLNGIMISGVQNTSASLRKTWYIVTQTNWFIDSKDTLNAEDPFATPPYAIATIGGESVRTWEYETAVDLHWPKLAYNDATNVTPIITMAYDGKTFEVATLDDLKYYINSAMPAGTYTVTVSAGAVKYTNLDGTTGTYPPVKDVIYLEVTPKAFDTEDLKAAIEAGKYEFPYTDGKYWVCTDLASVATELTKLNGVLNSERKKATAGYWATAAADGYYSQKAVMAHNLDRWGNNDYITDGNLPINADEYKVYYSLSAKNYQTYGGAEDENRRDKVYNVLIYNEISVKDQLLQIKNGKASYLLDVTYTGEGVYTSIPYSQYFKYDFDETADYVNVHRVSVKLTLNNPKLAKWLIDEGLQDLAVYADSDENWYSRFEIDEDDPSVLTAYYEILPADNSWVVTPSMPGWSYEGFDYTVHSISSKLKFDDTTSYFGINTKADGSGEWLTFGEDEDGNAIDYFTVDEYGQITDDNIKEVLNELDAGNYYLFGYASAYENNKYGKPNVNAYTPENANGIRIIINKANNLWETSPDVIRWYWSEYDKKINVFSGTPYYGTEVKYTILDSNRKAIDGLINIAVDANGEIIDEDGTIEETLKGLGRGNYYLLATVAGSENYTGINEYTMPDDHNLNGVRGLTFVRFTISQFNNYWDITPSMTGWQYDAYNVETDFVAGTPKFAGDEIVYKLYKNTGATKIEDNEYIGLLSDVDLQKREVGKYIFLATMEGTNDFTGLSAYSKFDITINQNNKWETIPTIEGWVYGAFDSDSEINFTVGTATYGKVVAYTLSKLNKTTEKYEEVGTFSVVDGELDGVTDQAELEKSIRQKIYAIAQASGAGDYLLTIVSKQTEGEPDESKDNYVATTIELHFIVDKAENEWAENKTPSIDGWTWGDTANNPYDGETKWAWDEYGSGTATISGVYWKSNSSGELISELDGKPSDVGLYAYCVTASETANYKGLTATAYFEIKQFENNWATAEDGTSLAPESAIFWTYGTDIQGNWGDINALKGEVTFTITGTSVKGDSVGYSAEDIVAKGGIVATLKALDAGTYSVISAVTCPENSEGTKNYSDLLATTSLSVRQATNSWGDVEPTDTEAERGKFKEEQFPQVKPTYGEVRYKLIDGDDVIDIEEEYFDLLTWAKQQRVGSYTVYAVVDGGNNYAYLEKAITVTVTRSSSKWDVPPDDYNVRYGFKGVIEVPAMDDDEQANVSYTFKYDGEANVEQPSSLTAESLRQYFSTKRRDAGIYTITALYSTEDEEFEGTVVITIAKAKINWVEGATPPVSVSFTYGNSDIGSYDAGNDLDGNKNVISYSVSSGGNVTAINGDLKTYLDSLDAGTYTLVVSANAADDINYEDLTANVEIHINKASNGWVTGTEPPASLNWVRGEAGSFTLPEPQHGSATVKITGGAITQNPTMSDLMEALNGLDEGIYTVIYTVTGDDVNYDGFEDRMQFIMSLQPNGWIANTVPDENLNLPWSASGITVKIPKAQKGTVKFDVELLSAETNINLPSAGCSEAVLRTWLAKVQSSTYLIRYYVDATHDYAGLNGQTFITVTKIDNEWTAAPANGSTVEWTFGDEASPAERGLDFKAVYGTTANNNLIVYYVNDIQADSLEEALDSLTVGEYTLRAEIPESQNYKLLSTSVTLKVVKAVNGWENDELTIGNWQWNTIVASSEVTMKLPKPLHGNVVNIAVSLDGTEIIAFVLNYYPQLSGNTTDNSAALRELLRVLDAGNYKVTAEIPESDNWGVTGVEVLTCNFTVSQNENEFYSNPYVNDWVYGTDRQYPQVVNGLKYKNISDIVYEYFYVADADGNPVTKTSVTELNTAGTYEFTATVAGTVNYPDLVYTDTFQIFRATPQWQMLPNITGWTWNEFNAENNLFVGAVDSGAEITFRIIDQNNKVVIPALKPDNSGVVTDEKILAILLNENVMLAGTYTFVANADATVNYNSIEVTGSFNIAVAENRWEEYPKIKEWAENTFTNENLPSAKSKYGNITLKITSIPQDGVQTITYFEAEYNSQGELIGDIKVRSFYEMKQGYYRFTGTVKGDSKKYSGLNYEDQIEVFISSSLRPKNGWEEVPKIDSWTAGEDGPTTDTARALRATAYLRTYYYVTDDGLVKVPDGELKASNRVDALGRVVYYPTNPGQYELQIKAIYEESSGIVEFDTLEETLPFAIYKRIIEWTDTPNIVNWEYGSAPSTPVASFNFIEEAESTLTIRYRQIKTSDGTPVNGELLTEPPTKAGGYEMIVTATAKYCDPVEAHVEFDVTLAKNSWIDIPGITEWTEEFDPNDPVGRAEHGEVTYVYRRKSDGKIFTELPNEEGEYTLCASVEAEGFERLYNEVDFSVGPAFDTTFLIIDIILASVLCALTVVVIVFAYRRYKENG